MSVHQCPRCELRFAEAPEVVQHLIDDHGVTPELLERRLSGLGEGIHPRRRPPEPVHPGSRVDQTRQDPFATRG